MIVTIRIAALTVVAIITTFFSFDFGSATTNFQSSISHQKVLKLPLSKHNITPLVGSALWGQESHTGSSLHYLSASQKFIKAQLYKIEASTTNKIREFAFVEEGIIFLAKRNKL